METLDIHGINAEGMECVIIKNVGLQSPISPLCLLFYHVHLVCAFL